MTASVITDHISTYSSLFGSPASLTFDSPGAELVAEDELVLRDFKLIIYCISLTGLSHVILLFCTILLLLIDGQPLNEEGFQLSGLHRIRVACTGI